LALVDSKLKEITQIKAKFNESYRRKKGELRVREEELANREQHLDNREQLLQLTKDKLVHEIDQKRR
jgi:hypothetical protein